MNKVLKPTPSGELPVRACNRNSQCLPIDGKNTIQKKNTNLNICSSQYPFLFSVFNFNGCFIPKNVATVGMSHVIFNGFPINHKTFNQYGLYT